jgi:hypothetical protein
MADGKVTIPREVSRLRYDGRVTIDVEAWSHVGVRVRERERSVGSYRLLGFEEVSYEAAAKVAILRHPSGMEINLIVNELDERTAPHRPRGD